MAGVGTGAGDAAHARGKPSSCASAERATHSLAAKNASDFVTPELLVEGHAPAHVDDVDGVVDSGDSGEVGGQYWDLPCCTYEKLDSRPAGCTLEILLRCLVEMQDAQNHAHSVRYCCASAEDRGAHHSEYRLVLRLVNQSEFRS